MLGTIWIGRTDKNVKIAAVRSSANIRNYPTVRGICHWSGTIGWIETSHSIIPYCFLPCFLASLLSFLSHPHMANPPHRHDVRGSNRKIKGILLFSEKSVLIIGNLILYAKKKKCGEPTLFCHMLLLNIRLRSSERICVESTTMSKKKGRETNSGQGPSQQKKLREKKHPFGHIWA